MKHVGRVAGSPAAAGGGEHGGSLLAGGFAAGGAAQHAGQLFQAFGFFEVADGGGRALAAALLADGPLVTGLTGDLW